MGKAKNILITIGASVAVGAAIGMLYAPVEGSEARKKIRRLKERFSCSTNEADEDGETLEELVDMLQNELNRINQKLEKL